MSTDSGFLPRIPLFEGIEPETVARVRELLHPQTVAPGSVIMSATEPGEAVYVLLEGTVKVYVEKEDGTELILALQGAGDVVGEMSLVDELGRSASVVAMEPCSLMWMDRVAFRAALRDSACLAHNLLQVLTARLRMANDLLLSLSALDVTGRVARQLLAFAQRYGEPDEARGVIRIPLRLTQSNLAGLVGASRERVNHAMAVFKTRGLVSVDQRLRITVHDPEALAEHCR